MSKVGAYICGPGDDGSTVSSSSKPISGGKGRDILYGGPGDDDVVGEEGDDVLYGGPGNDDLSE